MLKFAIVARSVAMLTCLKNKLAVFIFLIAVILYRTEALQSFFALSNSSSQFILAPLVLLSIAMISLGEITFPKYALGLTAVLTLSMGLAGFRFIGQTQDSVKFFFSPFIADRHETESIKFSDLMEQMFRKLKFDLQIERLSNPLADDSSVNDFIGKRSKENGNEVTFLLTGSPRWLNVYIGPRFAGHILSSEVSKILQQLGLAAVTEVSGTGFSDALSSASRDYLTRLLAAFHAINDGDFERALVHLADSASVAGLWSATEHRAYALWLMGTIYMNLAFRSEKFEAAYLECAIDYLNRARRFIRNDKDPELLGAILNNRAVAHFLSYVFHGQKKLRKQSLREFKAASKLKYRNLSIFNRPAWLVAKENLLSLKKPVNYKRNFYRKIRKKGTLSASSADKVP